MSRAFSQHLPGDVREVFSRAGIQEEFADQMAGRSSEATVRGLSMRTKLEGRLVGPYQRLEGKEKMLGGQPRPSSSLSQREVERLAGSGHTASFQRPQTFEFAVWALFQAPGLQSSPVPCECSPEPTELTLTAY